MPMMADLAQEKQRITDQLAKVDGERSRLQSRLSELEVAERVLSRFGKQQGETQRRGRPASAAPRPAGDGGAAPTSTRGARGAGPKEGSPVLGEATLRAVQAHRRGISAEDVRQYLAKEFGLEVRPNHLGMALQRHRRAGRLEIRDSRWHALD